MNTGKGGGHLLRTTTEKQVGLIELVENVQDKLTLYQGAY